MDRPSIRFGILSALLVTAAALFSTGGCQIGMFTLAYLIKGNDVPAEYKGLKKKTVAVVCRTPTGIKYVGSKVNRDLARDVGKLLETKGEKIKIVPAQDVNKWCDEHQWEEFVEVGNAVKADVVVGIDLDKFSLYDSPILYKGKANATVHVYDCKDGGKMVFEKILPPTVYPPNTVIETSAKQPAAFQQEFLAVLADQIARHFYPHDPYADFGQDADALK
jgi:hypothetical protein